MEVTFERGGTLPQRKIQAKEKGKNDFGVRVFPKEKAKQKHDSKRKEKTEEAAETNSARPLTLNSLVNDMIIYGIVKSIHPTHLFVSLPGRLVGRVPITNISKAYSNVLQSLMEDEDLKTSPKTLSEMFSVGQIVYAKVLDKCHGEKQDILLSLLPSDINSELSSEILQKGNVILCAVQEVEDHGYLMESGMNVKSFLPKLKAKNDLTIGELIFCKVQNSSSTVISLSAIKKGDTIKVETDDVPNLKTLMPGSIVNFNVVRILKNGLEGLLFDGSVTAYVNEIHIPSKLSTNDTSLIGKVLKGRVLYTMPLSNQIFVTLNISEVGTKKQILFGTVIQKAKVIQQTSGGVMFRVHENQKAFLPRRKIIKSLKNNFDIDTTLVQYSPNTQHDIRIMDYNVMEDCYLCTNDAKLLKEKYFSTYDLKIGEIITAKINEKIANGLKLMIGNIRVLLVGALYRKITKTESGSEVRVRIVEIEHDLKVVHVTNQAGFLKKENVFILDNKAKLKVGGIFTGLVMKESAKFYNILFFNHIKGRLLKSTNNEDDLIALGTLKEGTVKNFQISSVKGDKILLKVPTKMNTDNLGKVFDCKITAVLPSSLQIFVDSLKAFGKITLESISEFEPLRRPLMSAMKENSKLKVAALMNNQYSRRDLKYFSKKVKLDFAEVELDDVLRCFVKAVDEENIELECPLKNYTSQTIRLSRSVFDKPEDLTLAPGDVVYVNVIAKNVSHQNSLYVTPELYKVWRDDSEALAMLENYLADVDFLLQHFKATNQPLGKFSLGQRVSGSVKTVVGNNMLIELEGGIFAQGRSENQNCKVGSQVKDAVIVWIDPVSQVVFVTLNEKCKDEISIDQVASETLVSPKKHKAIIVYFNEFVTVCTIRKAGQPLIFIPSKTHYNDFSTASMRALGNASSKLVIKRMSEGKLLGTFIQDGKMLTKLEKIKNKLEQKVAGRNKRGGEVDESEIDNKRPKVSFDDSESENEEENETKEKPEVEVSKKSLERFSEKRKEFGQTIKNFVQQTVSVKKKAKFSKDSLVDENLVNLVSYTKITEDGKKSQAVGKKVLKKSTIGKKMKKPKRLITKK